MLGITGRLEKGGKEKRLSFVRDDCGREIDYLRLSVTDLCNFRCQYCMGPEGVQKRLHDEILSVEECVEIAGAAVRCGVRKIRLTGGEPLVRRGLLDICRGIRALPELRELCLTTNGSLLAAMAEPLRAAGVDRVNISLDTLREDRFAAMTRLGNLADTLAGIRAAEAAGFAPIKLDVVLIRGFNDDEIGDFLRLAVEHPWEVRFIELMPMGPCAGRARDLFLPADTILARFPALRPLPAEGVARRYCLPGAQGIVGLISPLSHEFCPLCRRIRVTADGWLKGCLHSREEILLRGLHGEALEDAIRQGTAQKPKRHRLDWRSSDTPRTMNQIGG